MDDKTRTELEAAAFRRLVQHLRERAARAWFARLSLVPIASRNPEFCGWLGLLLLMLATTGCGGFVARRMAEIALFPFFLRVFGKRGERLNTQAPQRDREDRCGDRQVG